MRYIIALFLCSLAIALSSKSAQAVNYENVICDNEPDPDQCNKIREWYLKVKQPYSQFGDVSCCGTADAYWIDQIDKITDQGVFATVTDKREIQYRAPRDGQHIFIPKDRLDDRFQGNPTGHNIVFLGAGISYYLDDGVGYPAVYCAFLNFGN